MSASECVCVCVRERERERERENLCGCAIVERDRCCTAITSIKDRLYETVNPGDHYCADPA